MKIGTDGVLIGAWAGEYQPRNILDVGTGTGLIALMLAQRFPESHITGIELDEIAAEEAQFNFDRSPFNPRLKLLCGDVTNQVFGQRFDLIVSNPPYFENALKAPDNQRASARQTHNLPFEELVRIAAENLSENGRFSVIVPVDASQRISELAHSQGLHCRRLVQVRGRSDRPVIRSMMEFQKEKGTRIENELIIEVGRHEYTSDYIKLTRDFYLNM